MAASTLLMVLGMATGALAQNPPIQTSDTFVLYPYITSGTLSGPYTNAGINKRYALRPVSSRVGGIYEQDCFNRMIFTNYVPTHCYSWQDQCGGQRWSLNQTYAPGYAEGEGVTIAGSISGLSSIIIASPTDLDEQGRRMLGWTSRESDCGNEPKMPGFGIAGDEEEEVLHLRYDAPEGEGFGGFYSCWVEGGGDIYGPRVFYRGAGEETPEGCVDVLLVPRCVNETALVESPKGARCYFGGLPE